MCGLAHRALRELLRLRSEPDSSHCNSQSALESARRALELADESARTRYPHEHDYVRAHWRLAEEALLITERSGYVLQGADAHLELAKPALGRGDKATAKEHARYARDLATCDGPPYYTYKAAYDEAGAMLEESAS